MSDSAARQWEWTFFCGHTTTGGNECADACPKCGETDLLRKTPAAATVLSPNQGGGKRFRKRPLNQAARGAYRSRTGEGFRNEPLDLAERRGRNPEAAPATEGKAI